MDSIHIVMCSCNPEGKQECETLLREVKKELNADDSNLINRIVWALNWDLVGVYSHITNIMNDQWSAISATALSYKDRHAVEELTLYVECDQVEVGIAAVWKEMSTHFGRRQGEDKEIIF